jgi:hypothetical protein
MSLMLLHSNTIPEGIQKACSDACVALLNESKVTEFETLSDFKKMLKDTNYVKDIVPKSFDPFANLNESIETKKPGEDTKTKQLF